jgi:hypothetical protein
MTPNRLRARVTPRSPYRLAAICVLAVAAALTLSACGMHHHAGEPVREGLSTPLGGLRYTVFMTRQLNVRNVEDKGYVPSLREPNPGHAYYGVFLQACNRGKKAASASDRFTIVDAQGAEFQPVGLGSANPFAYRSRARRPARSSCSTCR